MPKNMLVLRKKQAGNGLALQLVSQLYQMGIIEAHQAPGEKKKADQLANSGNWYPDISIS